MPNKKTSIYDEIETLLNSFSGTSITTGRKKKFRKVEEISDEGEGFYLVKYEEGERELIRASTPILIKDFYLTFKTHWEETCMESGCTNHFTDADKEIQRVLENKGYKERMEDFERGLAKNNNPLDVDVAQAINDNFHEIYEPIERGEDKK